MKHTPEEMERWLRQEEERLVFEAAEEPADTDLLEAALDDEDQDTIDAELDY